MATTTLSVPSTPDPLQSTADVFEGSVALFDYDPTVPFDGVVASEGIQDGVIVQDVSYAAYNPEFASVTGGRIGAYVVRPDGQGPFAGVLFLHQLERDQDRKEFLEEARTLAGQGVVSLLPDGLLPWKVSFTGDGADDQKSIVSQVIELRRALDFLLAQADVDPERIATVGHDYGAMHGVLLAGIEDRVKAYVFMTADSTYSNWAIRFFVSPPDPDAYRKMLAETDPLTFVSHASPAALLFQFSTTDRYVPEDVASTLFEAASEPKEILWYEAGHNLSDQAREDRDAWLTAELAQAPSP